ncbi:DUF732 domain-containing protein [Mycobacterium sp.]|uniref:DUF732 domain-containing protein n=1 Tax=Mycobacterium sp. TaxID=1785 RepID=UPI0025F6ED95|nr:DUF732 domain-containing protein [Mycobacterium sp.]MBW0014532.1 DUF732 domain-containing protein [Mycobacterium sp.]
MTVEDRDVPTGSELQPQPQPARSTGSQLRRQPRRTRRSRSKALGLIVGATAIAVAALAGLSAVADYALKDRTASSPGPPTMTVTASSNGLGPGDGADRAFLSGLASYNIPDHGEATRQRFMEYGHHVCFALLPPRPQSLEATVNYILVTQNQDVAKGDPWAQRLTHEDAEHIAEAAISAYCPNAPR